MTLRTRLTGVALLGVLTTCGLAACGSDDESSNTRDPDSRLDSGPSPGSSDDGGADDSGGPDGSGGGGSGGGDKPSKDEVVAGYTTIVNDFGLELPQDVVTQVVTCFVDEVYDEASVQTLQAIADADMTGGAPEDQQLFTDATLACQSQVAGG